MCTGPAATVPGELRGYRMWNRHGRQLAATNLPHGSWDVQQTAECRRLLALYSWSEKQDHVPHRAPNDKCSCGIYGWYRPTTTRLHQGDVFGVIAVSGRVLLGDYGFRAEHARILAVVPEPTDTSDASLLELASFARHWIAQGVQVFGTREELLEAFPPDDVRELLGRDVPEDDMLTFPQIPGSLGAHMVALTQQANALQTEMAKAMAELGRVAGLRASQMQAFADAFAKAVSSRRHRYATGGLLTAPYNGQRSRADVMREALEARKRGHRGPERHRRGRARLDGTP